MELSELPAVDSLQRTVSSDILPEALATDIARRALDRARAALLADPRAEVDAEGWARREAARVELARPRRIVNATGVLLHTNLGRAPQPLAAVEVAAASATGYSNLELDLASGRRGGRGRYAERLAAAVTGAEDALIVNNNAGGLLLALAALAGGAGVAVSRGELIEIGGSFRLPDLMAASGSRLIEVGTTNRTHPDDYRAVADRTAVILKIHPSNYRLAGFTAEVGWRDLASIAHDHGLPFVADVGSGLLDERTPWLAGSPPPWLAGEPAVRQTLAAGADVVLFSADKLLGGPQGGIAVGTGPHIASLRSHPLARAVRIGGPALAATACTLEMYASGRGHEIPFWHMASLPLDGIARRARAWAAVCEGTVVETFSLVGAGSAPGMGISTAAAAVAGDVDNRWRALLDGDHPVVARRDGDSLILDPRSVDPADDSLVVAALERSCR